jgi:hypothetical protein
VAVVAYEVTVPLVAVVNVLEVSVAVNVQAPSEVICSALKVATPATAATAWVPPSVHPDVIVTVSVKSLLATLPSVPSMVTLKVVIFVLTVTAEGGAVVNAT